MAKEKFQQKIPQAICQRLHTEAIMGNKGDYLNSNFNFTGINFACIKDSGYTLDLLIGPNHFSLFPGTENPVISEMVRIPLSSLPYL